MKSLSIVFFGTPDYVIPILNKLYKEFHVDKESGGIVGVVTKPPSPAGRDKKIKRSEVDWWAYKRHIPIFFDPSEAPEADLGVLASYGKIIPGGVLKKYKYGVLNVHPSLLPKYRGTSPVRSAIENGDTETGVTVIKLDSKMDHGPIVSKFKETIKRDDSAGELRKRLFERAASFLVDLIPSYTEGRIIPKAQNDKEATYTKLATKEDGFINMKDNQAVIERKIRAMDPWPGAWTYVIISGSKKRLKLLKGHLDEKNNLIVDEVQLEGKNPVSFEEFKRGYPEYEFADS